MNASTGYIFTAVGNLGKLVLKVANVELEVVTLSHFYEKEVVVIFLGLSYHLQTMEQTR